MSGRIGNPLSERLVDRGAQGLVARLHRDHLGPQAAHSIDVRRLAFDVDRTHVHRAGQADPGTRSSRRHAVLAGARFGDDPFDAEPLRQQRLADRIVDLVRARVRQVFALQPDFGTPAFAEPRRVRERRRPADPLAQLPLVVGLEAGLVQVLLYACLQAFECRHQGLGHVAATERAEAAAIVWQFAGDGCLQ